MSRLELLALIDASVVLVELAHTAAWPAALPTPPRARHGTTASDTPCGPASHPAYVDGRTVRHVTRRGDLWPLSRLACMPLKSDSEIGTTIRLVVVIGRGSIICHHHQFWLNFLDQR